MTHRSSSFHYFKPLKNTLGPHTRVWLHILKLSQVSSGGGISGASGYPWDSSLALDSQAGWQDLHMLWRAARIPDVSGKPCGGGRQPPARGAPLQGSTGKGISLCAAVKTKL